MLCRFHWGFGINKLAFAGRERRNEVSECPEIFLSNLNEVNSIC